MIYGAVRCGSAADCPFFILKYYQYLLEIVGIV